MGTHVARWCSRLNDWATGKLGVLADGNTTHSVWRSLAYNGDYRTCLILMLSKCSQRSAILHFEELIIVVDYCCCWCA